MSGHSALGGELADDLAMVLRDTGLLVQSLTPAGHVRFANAAWQATLGYDDADLARGLSFLEVVAPEERDHCAALFGRLMAGELVGRVETTFLTRAGERVEVGGDVRVRRDATGEIVATGGIFRDLRADRQQRRQHQALAVRNATLLAALAEGVILLNAAGEVEGINEAGERILGVTRRQVLGAAVLQLPWRAFEADGTKMERGAHPIIQALQTGEPQPERLLRFPRADGTERWISTAARALRDDEGQVLGAVSSFRDVTAQLTAEAALRTSEEQYRSLFERNASVQVIVDIDTGIIRAVNAAALRFYGYARDELVGQPVSILSRLEPASAVQMGSAVQQGRVSVFRRRQYCKSGEGREVEVYANAVHVGGEEVLHSIVIDVTARIEAEEAQRRLGAALDETPDVVTMFDRDGRPFYANRAGRLLVGLPLHAVGSAVSTMPDLPADMLRRDGVSARLLMEAMVLAEREGLWRGETTLRDATGRAHVMDQAVIAHRNADGTLSHFSTVLHDVTDARKAEMLLRDQAQELEVQTEELMQQSDELLAARDAADAANAAKSQFLAHMSHELRTPLTAIIGFSRVLASNRQGAASPQDVLYASRVSTNAVRLLGLIDQLLDLSKVEAGQMELEWSEVDVRAMALDVVMELDTRVRPEGVVLRADVPDGPAIVRADATKLRQVVVNLVGNALKFTLAGEVVVAVALGHTGRPASIAVRDTGVGIAAADQGAVFEPFAQADTSITRRFGGTGLGLAISRQYCDMMGFALTLESEPGAGSTFRVDFD